MFEFEVVRSI